MLTHSVEDLRRYDSASRRGGNLNEQQRDYYDAWSRVKKIYNGRKHCPVVIMSFKGARRTSDSPLDPLSAASPIRPVGEVRLVSLLPIPLVGAAKYLAQHAGGCRLHLADSPSVCTDGDVEFTSAYGGSALHVDLSKYPLQRRCEYKDASYDSELLGERAAAIAGMPGESQLKSTMSGELDLVRDDLYMRLTVNGDDMFRFRLEDEQLVSVFASCGQIKVGDPVATLKGRLDYLAAKTSNNRVIAHRHSYDMLAAECQPVYMALAIQSMHAMADYAEGACDGVSPDSCLSRVLLQFSDEVIDNRRSKEIAWRPTPDFQRQLRRAVSLDALQSGPCLRLRSPVDGELIEDNWESTYRKLVFRIATGEHLMPIPQCAALDHKPLPGSPVKVKAGQALGDYIPRAYYSGYDELASVADDCLPKLEDVFFEESLIRSGDKGWKGRGCCVDASFAGEKLSQLATDRLLDMSPMAPFFDKKWRIYSCLAVPMDLRRDGLSLKARGVRYNLTPEGKRFAGIRQQFSVAEVGSQNTR